MENKSLKENSNHSQEGELILTLHECLIAIMRKALRNADEVTFVAKGYGWTLKEIEKLREASPEALTLFYVKETLISLVRSLFGDSDDSSKISLDYIKDLEAVIRKVAPRSDKVVSREQVMRKMNHYNMVKHGFIKQNEPKDNQVG